ncbi:MAG: CBS domain-containing protein [Spirochaetia bacterium]|nr:CBS domain-containing protein [Spirochaetia bacterium]
MKRVGELMSRDVTILSPDARMMDHLNLFKDGSFHHAPVVDSSGALVGMVSSRDFENYVNITRILQQQDDPVLIKDVMRSPVFSYSEDVGVDSAAQAMVDNDVHAIAVTNNGKLTGILTVTDILKALAGRERWSALQ